MSQITKKIFIRSCEDFTRSGPQHPPEGRALNWPPIAAGWPATFQVQRFDGSSA